MDNKKINFEQIAGYKEEKKALKSISSLIKRREELKAAGGKLPRGIFLIGPNGVGKTVLAKAFIEDSGCETVVVSYNDIDDDKKFASYIKQKFQEAASKAPCILFIDELDKIVGNDRFFFMPDNMDNSRILLNEINKYADVEGLFLLLVGNKQYHVDYSIVRSGRIDRTIEIDYPDESERKEIIKYYIKGKKTSDDVHASKLAKTFRNFSGADIESIFNNALIKAFSENRDVINNADIMEVYYDKLFKTSGKEQKMEDKNLEVICVHEAGHATVSILNDPDKLDYVSILNRGNAKGFINQHDDEYKVKTLEQKKNEVKTALAGYVAEKVILNTITNGSESDLEKARQIVTELIRLDGYKGLEYLHISSNTEELSHIPNSQIRLNKMEKAEDELLTELYDETIKDISDHKEMVSKIANELKIKKVLERSDIERIIQETTI